MKGKDIVKFIIACDLMEHDLGKEYMIKKDVIGFDKEYESDGYTVCHTLYSDGKISRVVLDMFNDGEESYGEMKNMEELIKGFDD